MLIASKFFHPILTAIRDICCAKNCYIRYNILLAIEYHKTDQLRPFTCYACMGGGACYLIQMGYRQFCRSPKSLLYTGIVQDTSIYVR